MKLELAIVLSCKKTGCRVSPLEGGSSIEVRYSTLVQDRIMIQPEQMVVINTDTNPPKILWRWARTTVIEPRGDVVIVDKQGHSAKLSRVEDLPLVLKKDDEVLLCGIGHDHEIHDIIIDGKPRHPNRLLNYITPIIEEIYG